MPHETIYSAVMRLIHETRARAIMRGWTDGRPHGPANRAAIVLGPKEYREFWGTVQKNEQMIETGKPPRFGYAECDDALVIESKTPGILACWVCHAFIPGRPSTSAGKIMANFIDLPLGSRFRYATGPEVWVVLERHGCGLVAKWEGSHMRQWVGQSICSAADTPAECENLFVEVVD